MQALSEASVEHIHVFALLCVCVLYICKIVGNFQDQKLRVRRESDEENKSIGTEEHSI